MMRRKSHFKSAVVELRGSVRLRGVQLQQEHVTSSDIIPTCWVTVTVWQKEGRTCLNPRARQSSASGLQRDETEACRSWRAAAKEENVLSAPPPPLSLCELECSVSLSAQTVLSRNSSPVRQGAVRKPLGFSIAALRIGTGGNDGGIRGNRINRFKSRGQQHKDASAGRASPPVLTPII